MGEDVRGGQVRAPVLPGGTGDGDGLVTGEERSSDNGEM